jgi:hypothetical protein
VSGTRGRNGAEATRAFLGAFRPGALLLILGAYASPILLLILHLSRRMPGAFVRAWYVDPRFQATFAWASCALPWACFATILVLSKVPRIRRLVVRPEADRDEFDRRLFEAAAGSTVVLILASFLWCALACA